MTAPTNKTALSVARNKFRVDSEGNILTVGGENASSNIGKAIGIGTLGETTFVSTGGSSISPSDTVSYETSFGASPSAGTATTYARGDHTHGTPTNPVTSHETLYAGDSTPSTIILRDLPVADAAAAVTMWLYAGDSTPTTIILRNLLAAEAAATYYGVLKRWTGAAWVKAKLMVRQSGAWVAAKLKRRSGSDWLLIDTGG